MNSTIMLFNLRTLLDESTEGNWTDIECFQALSNGQIQVINLLLTKYKINNKFPSILEPLITSIDTDTDINGLSPIPLDFIYLLNAQLNLLPCKKIQLDDKYYFRENNIYQSSSSTEPIVITENSNFKFNVSAITSLSYNYIKSPIQIAAAVDPAISSQSHPAIVIYAFAELLKKLQRNNEALNNFNQFIKMVQMF